jgi:hypothetical protein
VTEQIIREAIAEKERQKDRVDDANRFGRIESVVAVLQTRFEEWVKRAVQGDDLKELRREMEEEMGKQISHICDHFDTKIGQQSKELLNEFRTIMTTEQLAQSQALLQANADNKKEIIRYGIGFALSVIAALVIFWLTGR